MQEGINIFFALIESSKIFQLLIQNGKKLLSYLSVREKGDICVPTTKGNINYVAFRCMI